MRPDGQNFRSEISNLTLTAYIPTVYTVLYKNWGVGKEEPHIFDWSIHGVCLSMQIPLLELLCVP